MVEIVDYVGWGERREGKVVVRSRIDYTLYKQDPRRVLYVCYIWDKKWVQFYVKWLMRPDMRDLVMYVMHRYEVWCKHKLAFKVLMNDAIMVLYDWVSRDEDRRFADVDIEYDVGYITLTARMKHNGKWYGQRNMTHIASLVNDYQAESWVDYIRRVLGVLEQAATQGGR